MKKAGLLTAALVAGNVAMAQLPVSVISGNITSDRTFSNDTVYQLDGFVYVKNNATLTVEAGTVVQGYIDPVLGNSKGTLIITRTGFIDARGTECEPIVFTSANQPGLRGTGDWGGIIVLGEATINRGTDQGGYYTDVIEGGLTGDVADRTFGGNNDQDSSGVMQYVRIEFAGIAFTPNNEINSLTTGGVGEKTVIDHIMVSYAGDDAFEMFGGKWNGSHLIAHRTLDDNFDCDQGYRGNIQWGIVYHEANTADISRSEGWETDNWSSNPNGQPRTAPVFSNITLIGPKATGTPNSLHQSAARIRRGSWTSIHNSVFVDHLSGLYIDGNDTYAGWNAGMEFKGNIMAGMTDNYKAAGTHTVADMGLLWEASNTNYANTSSVGFNAAYNVVTGPNLVPEAGSVLLSGSDWTFTGASDFNQVSYRGALDRNNDWTANWTEWDPQTADYSNGISTGVSGVMASTPGNYTASLSWTSTGASVYNVWFRMVGDANWTRVNSNTNSRSIRPLAPGNYEYYISESAGANPSCIETFSIDCEDFTYSTNVFQINDATGGKVNVFGVSGGRRTWDFGISNGTDTTWANNRYSNRFLGLTPGTYTIYVKDAYDCYSTQASQVTINAVDSNVIPTLTNVQNLGGGTLRPIWTVADNSGLDAYQIRVRDLTGGGSGTLYNTYVVSGGAATQFDVTGLPAARYRIDVRSRATGGVFAGRVYSNFMERIVSSNKNGGADASIDGVNVVRSYPNPTSEHLYVVADQGSNVMLMDMSGRVIAQQDVEASEVSFNMSALPAGVYMVRITNGAEVITEKIVKQ